ncbi:hypothetical protein V5O48_011635 [Marasmius crinis-equi]|uniref:3'-5' exonuclease domain-containing protein n=1 Tax=Marasmius crinis-equi TaxID=585013 RepID=A0ABR3F549_9AGAR
MASLLSSNDLANALGQLSVSSKPKPPRDVSLCDTQASFDEAITRLNTFAAIIFDCEGEQLGTVGGALSLVVLRGVPASRSEPVTTFIFDIPQLSGPAIECTLEPLLDILSSSSIQKVVFDGRMDFSAIWFGYGVELRNVIDLQVVDVKKRTGDPFYQKRLKPVFGPKVADDSSMRNRFTHIHMLTGLGKCMESYNVVTTRPKGNSKCSLCSSFAFSSSEYSWSFQLIITPG